MRAHLNPPVAAVPPGPPVRQPRPVAPGRLGVGTVVLALGSMGLGIGASAAVLHPGGNADVNGGFGFLVALIWIVIGIINVAYARRR